MLVNPIACRDCQKYYDGLFEGGINGDYVLWGRNDFPRSYDQEYGSLNPYGVADSPSQFYEKFGAQLASDPRPLVVLFGHIEKEPGHSDGWRWHKWGPYVGNGQPTTEYLDDEAEFDEGVYVYHVYLVDNLALEEIKEG